MKGKIKLNLEERLVDFDTYIDNPFIIFEKKNFLDSSVYNNLVDEVYELSDFEDIFGGKGGKLKSSINGDNVNTLPDGVFKELCKSFFSTSFFRWFEKTHLPHFKLDKKIYFYTKHPRNFFIRLISKITNIFNIPLCYFYTEVEYSSIKKDSFIPPHTDVQNKRLSFVYYLPSKKINLTEDMKLQLGTVFWEPKLSAKNPLKRFDCGLLTGDEKKSFFDDYQPFHIATYEPNKFAGFIKSDNSWHTVENFNFEYDRRAIVINIYQL